MASRIENTFGSKLRKAKDLLQHISRFSNYGPPRNKESIAEMTTLINAANTANTTVTSAQQAYTQAVSSRQAAFRGKEIGLSKRLTLIRDFAAALYGKSSNQYGSISSIIKTMRSTRITKPPKDPSSETKATTISQSQLSYGSQIQNFQRLIDILSGYGDFNPNNALIQLNTLQTLANDMNTMSDAVVTKIGELRTAQASRRQLYEELKERVQRIKAYVRVDYGTKSNEYNLIKKIKL